MENLEKIDFGKFQKEYKYLNDWDVGFLNKFVNTNLDTFLSLKKNFKKYSYFKDIFLSIILGILFSILLYIILPNMGIKWINESNIFLYLGIFVVIVFIFFFIFFSRSGKKDFSPEKTSDTIFFIKNFINNIDEKISYSGKDDFFHEDLKDLGKKLISEAYIECLKPENTKLKDSSNILGLFPKKIDCDKELKDSFLKFFKGDSKKIFKNYDRIDKTEDSIEFKVGEKSGNGESKIQVNGIEIQTSVRRRSKNTTYYETNNHFYLIKFKFLDARFKINSAINILQDVSDNLERKLMKILGLMLIPVVVLLYSGEKSDTNLLLILSQNLNIPKIPLFIAIMTISFAIIWFLYSKFLRKNKINLENPEFEKKFDVYDEDQIESRKILTPSFMYRILDFVNKINKNRVYEFFFLGDEIYIKYDLLKSGKSSFMEIDFSKGQDYVLKSFLEFYLEIKNITEIAKDLNVFYFDKGTFSKEILRNR